MRIAHLLLLVCLVALTTGCLVSEQIGGPIGHGNSLRPGDDVAIHFDTEFNRILMFGRSALLVVVAAWIFHSWGARAGSILVGGGILVAAGWFFVKGYSTLAGYRVEVAESGLTLKVPPELDEQIPWQNVEGLELEGWGYARIGGSMQYSPLGGATQAALELPDWETMKVLVTGGNAFVIDLSKLSIEHRQIFAKALIKRADLVEQ